MIKEQTSGHFWSLVKKSAPLVLGGKELPVITTTKYLDFHVDSDLSGDSHINQMIRKASKSLYFLTALVQQGLPHQNPLTIFLLGRCNKSQAAHLERLQKRALNGKEERGVE